MLVQLPAKKLILYVSLDGRQVETSDFSVCLEQISPEIKSNSRART